MDPYVRQLLDAFIVVVPQWLERCVVETSTRLTGGCPDDLRSAAAAMAERVSPQVVEEMEALLATDVERQRTNPLSVIRAAVRHPTALLVQAGVAPIRRDEFAIRAFPDDLYGLSPAGWSDVDESLQEPGIIWGAWKAKSVLDRRRQRGLSPDPGPPLWSQRE